MRGTHFFGSRILTPVNGPEGVATVHTPVFALACEINHHRLDPGSLPDLQKGGKAFGAHIRGLIGSIANSSGLSKLD
jgi:hypothetical protein